MKRIAMWSGPRNISTAMMRSFENRGDTVVIDEPFYACFLERSGIDHPGREIILQSQSTDTNKVIESLVGPHSEAAGIFYQKHMCHHMLDGMELDWMKEVTNVFLIRDPRAMIASYVKSREAVEFSDLGARQMIKFFDAECDRLGTTPIVIESADVLKDPEGMLEKLCNALEIPFDIAMLNWPQGKRDSDGVWAPHWYASVEKSTGFMPYSEREIELSPELERIADQCMPAYEKLLKYALLKNVKLTPTS